MIFDYLRHNVKWTFKKQLFQHLLATPVSQQTMYDNLRELFNSLTDGNAEINLFDTQFALNGVVLYANPNGLQRTLLPMFNEFDRSLKRIKSAFKTAFSTFPTVKGEVRLLKICQEFAVCTQMCYSQADWNSFKDYIKQNIQLTNSEQRFFDTVFELVKCQYFCAVFFFCGKNSANGEFFASNLLPSDDSLKGQFSPNDNYSRTTFKTSRLFCAVDCFANSATLCDGQRLGAFLNLEITQNGRTVFDTFVSHKYGRRSANFLSSNKSSKVEMQYFVRENVEVRKYAVYSLSKTKSKYSFTVNCGVENSAEGQKINYFESLDAHCLGISGLKPYYVAFVVVANNKIVKSEIEFDENGMVAQLRMKRDMSMEYAEKHNFEVVAIYAESVSELVECIQNCNRFGFTHCPIVSDQLVEGQQFSVLTHISPASNLIEYRNVALPARVLNFSYQFGDFNTATFLDNDGHSVTMLNGFAFGVEGEKLYAISNGMAKQINCGKFELTTDGYTQCTQVCSDNATLTMSHREQKSYKINFEKPKRLLALFSFEQTSIVTFQNNVFEIKSQDRHFKLAVSSKIESFTTNAIECNSQRLRHKLSNDIASGQCLAICFSPSTEICFAVENCKKVLRSQPVVKESLLSTYLNYVNDKNLFCLNNRLKPADALTVSALAYTNHAYLRQYIERLENSTFLDNYSTCYYDSGARLKSYVDKILYALAVTYYVAIANATDFLTSKRLLAVKNILLKQSFTGKQLCLKALALKKFSQLNIDKVNILSEYSKVKTIIANDKTLYAYAQAIGAVEMINPSKQRLKDLTNSFDVPKCWYYVSQLENIYGLKINCNTLMVKPNISAENHLEEFVLNFHGFDINTSFEKSSVQSMQLNGTTYFNCVNVEALRECDNKMVIKY